MRKKKKINYRISKKYRNMKEVIEKRYFLLIFMIAFSFLIVLINLSIIQIFNHNYYVEKVNNLKIKTVSGASAPRGRIYDRHHRLIVDNKPLKTITYKRASNISDSEEIKIAYKLSKLIELDYAKLSEVSFKKFFLKNNYKKGYEKITELEWKMYKERRLNDADIEKLKLERITSEDLSIYDEEDKKAAYVYFLMNNGYYFMDKTIKDQNVTDFEFSKVSESLNELTGVKTKLDWERVYPYGEVFKTILGNVSTAKTGIPAELKDYYLSKGYRLDDRVGTSYIEYQFEDFLKGEKNVYEISGNNEKLISEGKRGNDIVLTIDIELQRSIEEILRNELINAKAEKNTEYLKNSFVVISDPRTGEILAMAGTEVYEKDGTYNTYDFTPGIATNAVVAGSVVKGASHIVAYNNGALNIGEKRDDFCIKILSTPEKCSWKYLGMLDDISALKLSSNSYQYQSAIKVAGATYKRNGSLNVKKEAFETYRNTFAEFGLGIKTGIDLPVESVGYKGSNTQSGHLLDFAIGQYDTYTPIQLSQYINTIANGGTRLKPQIIKTIYNPNEELNNVIYNIAPVVQNKIETKDEFIKRVQEGFRTVVMPGGTGSGYIKGAEGAGKTGTSEGFIDTNNDGLVDTMTYSRSFVGYAPYDNPRVSFTIISPSTSHNQNDDNYKTSINYRISSEVSKKFFEIYR